MFKEMRFWKLNEICRAPTRKRVPTNRSLPDLLGRLILQLLQSGPTARAHGNADYSELLSLRCIEDCDAFFLRHCWQ